MSAEKNTNRAKSLPVIFNGVRLGHASTKEKAMEVLEASVLAFMGFPGAHNPLTKHKAWTKLALVFGYPTFDENVLEDKSIDSEHFVFEIKSAAK